MTTATVDESKYIQRGIPVSNGKLAMWLFLVTEIMFFTGLIGTYIVLRKSTPAGGWPEPKQVHLDELLGAINTFVLIFSSFTVVKAHSAIARGDSKWCTRYIAITFICGWIFMGIKAYEYTAKFQHGIMPGRMADNLVDPALRNVFFRTDPKTGREEEVPVGELPADYRHLREDDKYWRWVKEAGKHPYDPNVAQRYRGEVKQKLAAANRSLLDKLAPLEDAITKKVAAAEAELKKADPKATLPEERRRAIVEEERKPVLEKASEKEREIYHLVARLNSEIGNRPITALEVAVDSHELNEKYHDLHLPPFVMYGNLWSSSYFAMTGFHAVHVLGGIVVFGIILIHGLRGRLVKNAWNVSMLELTGLYWHFVDVVWIFLFPLLYLV